MILALDPSTHDLQFVSGQLVLLDPNSYEARAQKLKTRILFVRGEWFLDPSKGIAYFEDVFIKNPDLAVVKSHYVNTILDTPGVTGIKSLDAVFNRAERTYYLDFVALFGQDEVQISGMEVAL